MLSRNFGRASLSRTCPEKRGQEGEGLRDDDSWGMSRTCLVFSSSRAILRKMDMNIVSA